MCGNVDQTKSVSTVLGIMECLYADRTGDASLLMGLYVRECRDQGADDGCVLSSMLSASMYVSMTLLGSEGKDRVDALTMWWAEQCPQ